MVKNPKAQQIEEWPELKVIAQVIKAEVYENCSKENNHSHSN